MMAEDILRYLSVPVRWQRNSPKILPRSSAVILDERLEPECMGPRLRITKFPAFIIQEIAVLLPGSGM